MEVGAFMDKNKFEIIRLRMERTAEALRRNNMYCVCVDCAEEALEIIEDLIEPGSTVAIGGSMTLFEAGVIDMLRNGSYNFLDRYEKNLTPGDIRDIYLKSFGADVYLTSTNAVTEKGELFNIDGNGNRVAAMIYGPESVIIVAGYNKITKDIDQAKTRLEEIAAPSNALRLGLDTPCAASGKCCKCMSDKKICCDTVIMGHQRVKDRIKVILVGEELGY